MDGQDLIASYSNGAIQYYADAAMSNPVAVFTPPEAGDQHNGTITWYVASELGNETRSLTFQVQAVGDHYTDAAQYPDIPDQNTGNTFQSETFEWILFKWYCRVGIWTN